MKLPITARFVVGAIFLVGGLATAVYIFEGDLFPTVMEAQESGRGLRVNFALMLKAVIPLAVALLGLRLIKSKSKASVGDE